MLFNNNIRWLTDNITSGWGEFIDVLRGMYNSYLPRLTLGLLLLLIISGLAIILVEGTTGPFDSFLTAIWWGIVTIATVGYGDVVPHSVAGKIVAMFVILTGVMLMSVFSATVSSIFVAAKIKEGQGLQQVHYHEHIVICGWGQLTEQLLEMLLSMYTRRSFQVVLVADLPGTLSEELTARFSKIKLRYVRGDWTHEATLKRAGVGEARTVVILPEEALHDPAKMDEKTILATLTIKSMNTKVKLLAHIMRRENRVFLQRARADEIVVSDEFTPYILATHSLISGVPQIIREMLSTEGSSKLVSSDIPPEFVGKTFADLGNYYFQKGDILLGLTREENPLQAADILSSDMSALDEFIKRKFEEAGLNAAEQARTKARLNPPRDSIIQSDDHAIVVAKG